MNTGDPLIKKSVMQMMTKRGNVVEITSRDNRMRLTITPYTHGEGTGGEIEMDYETFYALALAISWLEPTAFRK